MGGIALAPLITKIQVDIKGFKNDMEKVKTEAVTKANEVSKKMQSTVKAGQTMSKLGSSATKFLTVPLLAAGTAVGKLGLDLSKNMGLVTTLLDGSTEQVNKRTEELKQNVFKISKETGLATDNISKGLYQVVSAFGDTADSAKILEIASKGAKAGNAEVTDSINLLSAVTKGYGDTSAKANSKVSDLAFLTAKLGQTTFPELAGSMGKVVPLAENLKVSQEELFGVMATATGVTGNASEVTTQFKGILQSLMAPTDDMTKLMKKYGYENGQAMIKSKGLQGSIDLITQEAKKSGKPLQSYIGSIEGQTLALALSGAQHDVFTEKLEKMQHATGATDEAFKRVNDTAGAKFSKAMNNSKIALTKLGDALAPILTKGADLISKLADKISSMKPGTLDMIAKIGLTVAAAGPLLKILGGLVSGYGKLKPAISGANTMLKKGLPMLGKLGTKLAKNSGLVGKFGGALAKLAPSGAKAASGIAKLVPAVGGIASSAATAGGAAGVGGLLASLGGMAVAAAPFVAGAAVIGVAGYGIYKTLSKEVIPAVDLYKEKTTVAFNEVKGTWEVSTTKISEETQKQVQSYINLSDKTQQESMNMYLGITKVTDNSVASITNKVNQMSTSIVSSIDKQKNDSIAKYQDMFKNTTAITNSEQSEILKSVESGYKARVSKTEDLKQQLTNIYNDIKKQSGAITKSQQEQIDNIYKQMKEQAVQAMSKSKAEQEVILNNLNESSTRITADMAGKAIREMNKIETKSVDSAKKKRDELVLQANELKTVEGGKYKEKADEIIKQANREYKETVSAASKTKKEGIDKLMSAHTELANEIDIKTGEVVNYLDKLFGKWDKWKPDDKNMNIVTNHVDVYERKMKGSNAILTTHYNGKAFIPYDGYNATLHKGERVMTAKENEEYTKAKIHGDGGSQTINFNGNYSFRDQSDIDYFMNQAALKIKARR